MDRVAVLVAGMHRSGTSALTRMLVGVGCDAPRTCMEADAHNALGYWESKVIVELNDAILASGGSSWDDWGPFNPAWRSSPAAAPFHARAVRALEREFGNSPLFVLKDPRIGRLLTFWKESLEAFGATTRLVLPVRNPLEVAASLARRDLIEEPYGALLWLRNVLEAEADSRGDERAFIRYDDVLVNWEAAAGRLARQLSITWPKRSTLTTLEIDENLPQKLKHQVRTDADVSDGPGVAEWVKSTYAILARWTRDDVRKGDAARLDATKAALDEAEAVFRRPLVLGVRARQREARLEGELAEHRQGMEALAADIKAKDGQLATKDGRLAELGETLAARDVRIDALEHEVLGRDGHLRESAQRIDALEHEVLARDERIREAAERAGALEREVAARDVRIREVAERAGALEREVAARDGRLREAAERAGVLEREVLSRDARIHALEQEVLARDKRIREAAEHIAGLDAHAREQAQQLDALHASTSWRITRPLRAIKRFIGAASRRRVLRWVMAPARLAWRLLPLGKARKERLKGRAGRRLPKRLAVHNASLYARADGFAAAGRLDLADYSHRAAQGKGAVPILFDPDWYLANNDDVKSAGVDPLHHYLESGAIEGRLPVAIEPNAIDPAIDGLHRLNLNDPDVFRFDAAFYRALYPELAPLDDDALARHYEEHGRTESRAGSKGEFVAEFCIHPAEIPLDFRAEEYISLYPDLSPFGERPALEALRHYMLHGRWEPRLHTLRGEEKAPSRQPALQPTPAGARRPLCVLAHVYYPELWPELAGYIDNLPSGTYDLYVNLVDATFTQASLADIREGFPAARVYVSENVGRDIGGHFQLLRNLRMEDYDIFCLLHTKRSPHMAPGEAQRWRRKLLMPLLGSGERAIENIKLMQEDDTVGQLGAAACRYTELNDNPERYFDALRRLGIDEDATAVEFLSGTMMFVRAAVLRRVFEGLRDVDFEVGDGGSVAFHRDGQWAHAVERAIGTVVRDMGYRFEWRQGAD